MVVVPLKRIGGGQRQIALYCLCSTAAGAADNAVDDYIAIGRVDRRSARRGGSAQVYVRDRLGIGAVVGTEKSTACGTQIDARAIVRADGVSAAPWQEVKTGESEGRAEIVVQRSATGAGNAKK